MTAAPLHIVLSWSDWLGLFGHYLLMSMMSIGGAISTTAEMHRYLVEQHQWLTHAQFNAAIALAQAAPGPNVLFVALLGWQVGINAGSMTAALLGVAITMGGILLPSGLICFVTAQWGHRNRELRAVRAFKQGMAPVVIALLLAVAWILGSAGREDGSDWPLWLLAAASAVLFWRSRLHVLWLLGAGAIAGWFGLV